MDLVHTREQVRAPWGAAVDRCIVSIVKAHLTVLASVMGTWLTGCGRDTTVSIVGESPDDQADDIASAVCEREQQCGKHRVYCETSGDGVLHCTGIIDRPSFETCYENARANTLEDLLACELTRAQETTVQTCINATLAQSCVTQAELDAQALAIEAGALPEPLRPLPPECAETDAIFEGCAP